MITLTVTGESVDSDVFWSVYNILVSAVRTKNQPVLELAQQIRDKASVHTNPILAVRLRWADTNGQMNGEVAKIISAIFEGELGKQGAQGPHISAKAVSLTISPPSR